MIRKPIIVVMGHIDAGKTKLLDSIRGTAIAEKEAGFITQHIGATEVPIEIVKKIAGKLLDKYRFNIAIPGLLFIDTPGHEAFTNLRKRGGSIADLAILVVNIEKGVERQTIEAIEILKSYKTPFVVVANKVDLIKGWQVQAGSSVTDSFEHQHENVLAELDKKTYELVGQLHKHGFVSERFDRIKDFSKEISIIPASVKNKEGIAEILLFLAGLSQRYLGSRLEIAKTENPKGTVLEVKEEKGIGKTMDVILYEGHLVVGQEIVVGGKSGAITTKIRALLEPKPIGEMKNQKDMYRNVKEVFAAAGVKIAAPALDEVLAGSPLRANIGNGTKEVMEELNRVRIDSEAIGVVVRADTLGSLEALTKLLLDKGVKTRKADVGPVSKRDLMEAHAVALKEFFRGVVFAFNVPLQPGVEEEAHKMNLRIFSDKVIYKMLEDYFAWVNGETERQKKEKLDSALHPFSIRVLRNHIFRASKPAVVGVKVEAGKMRTGIDLLNKGEVIGRVKEMQLNGKNIQEAKKGDEVAVSIEGGSAGKNFKEDDLLYSSIPPKHLENLEKIIDSLDDDEVELLRELKEMKKQKVQA